MVAVQNISRRRTFRTVETQGHLNKRNSGHRFQINDSGGQLLYRHFNQPDHSIVSIKVSCIHLYIYSIVIIEEIYRYTNSPTLNTHFLRQREEFWIKTFGTASPYGCKDNLSSIGNLTSPYCSKTNAMNIFPSHFRRKWSHGHRHYTSAWHNDISFDDILPFLNKSLGIHHIRYFSIPLAYLQRLYNRCLNTHNFDTSSLEYKLNSIILDIANCRMFKPVNSDVQNESPRKFPNK